MAWYKYDAYVQKSAADAYDLIYGPGSIVPYSGIYRCQGCGREIASNEGNPFPPQNHHQHNNVQGAVFWRLAVYADANVK